MVLSARAWSNTPHCNIQGLYRQPVGLIFGKSIVRIAVQPSLAGLRRGNDRMPARVRVLAGVTVRRRIAAERRATLLARPQMDPCGANFHAFIALSAFRVFDGGDGFYMRAGYV
jgi:hypothetical protein